MYMKTICQFSTKVNSSRRWLNVNNRTRECYVRLHNDVMNRLRSSSINLQCGWSG